MKNGGEMLLTGKNQNKIEQCQAYRFGKMYRGVCFDKLKPRNGQEAVLSAILKEKIGDVSLYLTGKNRTGKTHFLAAIYHELLSNPGYNWLIKVFKDIKLAKTLIDSQFNCYDISYEYEEFEYFFFTDFGKTGKALTSNERRDMYLTGLFEIFDHIVSNDKKMFIASNYTVDELSTLGGNWLDISARINEQCKIIEL